MVEANDFTQDVDDLRNPLVPSLFSFFSTGGIADVLVIGLAAADRVVCEFEMGHHLAGAKNRRPGASAERQHHLDPMTFDRTKALDVRVVEDPDRFAETLGEHRLQIEVRQRLSAKVRRCDDPSIAYVTGKADRYLFERPQRRHHPLNRADKIAGGDRFSWRRHALAFADYVPISIEECGLYSGAADIYRERARFIHDLLDPEPILDR